MRILDATFDLDTFFLDLARAPRAVLMLDYDGTLAPFHREPARAAPYPGIVPALNELMETSETRVVIVSGRWTRDLLPLIGLRERPEIWGVYGWERLMPDGRYVIGTVPESALAALVAADDWAEDLRALGAREERKPASVAFHWRGRRENEIGSIREALMHRWTTLDHPSGLVLRDFDGGMELCASGHDKGDAVRTLTSECGPDAIIAFLGDDDADEDAFRAVPAGGAAVLVSHVQRPSAAHLWLQPPGELLMFLRRWRSARRDR
ncbi:MAG TPA: trehalose-phosphatase [Gammaproteobacteria bacterium]|nr:trehalose-phosphatase [Gammaproteobacteria bacterium]